MKLNSKGTYPSKRKWLSCVGISNRFRLWTANGNVQKCVLRLQRFVLLYGYFQTAPDEFSTG